MFSDSSVSLVKVNLEVKSGLMLYFHLYNYAIQNNLVSESYDATWNCPNVTKIAQLWDFIEISSFCEDIKGIKYIHDNVDDYNDKEANNKNDTYNKDNKVDCPVNSQTQTQSNKKMSGLYNHFRSVHRSKI